MTIALRRANETDAETLFQWANDPVTRANSFSTAPVQWPEHVAWLARRIQDAGTRLWLAVVGDDPVGSIRFQTQNNWSTAILSYQIAPTHRGLGLSRPIVTEGVRLLRAEYPGVVITAEVKPENARSLAVFRRLNWPETMTEGAHHFVDRH